MENKGMAQKEDGDNQTWDTTSPKRRQVNRVLRMTVNGDPSMAAGQPTQLKDAYSRDSLKENKLTDSLMWVNV